MQFFPFTKVKFEEMHFTNQFSYDSFHSYEQDARHYAYNMKCDDE